MRRKRTACEYQLELALSYEPDVVEAVPEKPADEAPVTAAETAVAAEAPHASDASDASDAPESLDIPDIPAVEQEAKIQEARLWCDDGWTARIIKNEGDDGWAVEMTRDGEAEPALVSPWTMGRDKKNPKPLDAAAFATLVKTASEVRRRHEQQMHAMLHKSVVVASGSAMVTVTLDVVPDEDHPYATLAACDESGVQLAQARVAPGFRLSKASATAWVASGFRRHE